MTSQCGSVHPNTWVLCTLLLVAHEGRKQEHRMQLLMSLSVHVSPTIQFVTKVVQCGRGHQDLLRTTHTPVEF